MDWLQVHTRLISVQFRLHKGALKFSLMKGEYVYTYARNKLNFKVKPCRVDGAWYFSGYRPTGGRL
jgi:hypothetical protein